MSTRAQPVLSGDLREVLAVQNAVRVDLGGGASTTTWQPQGTLRGRVRTLRGREHLEARQVVGSTAHEVTVAAALPPGTSLTSRSRLVWQSHPMGARMLEVVEPPRLHATGRYLVFLCAEQEPLP